MDIVLSWMNEQDRHLVDDLYHDRWIVQVTPTEINPTLVKPV